MNFHLTPLSRLINASFFCFLSICVFNSNELEAASFDCSKASNKVERTICSVDSISALDDKLALAYKNAGSSYKQSQRDWLKKRNKCGADANCLFNEYKARIDFLIGVSSKPRSVSKRLVSSNLADCAPNVFHNCYGTYTWDTGEKYVGEWQNRMRVGNGVFTYKNGNKYTGSWQSNVPDGQGSLLATDGKVYVGKWIDGQYQQPKIDTADARTGNTFESITKTNWTLWDWNNCGTAGKDINYQRFLPNKYYNVINGNKYSATKMTVQYFEVNEERKSFEAQYSTFTAMEPNHPWTIISYSGELLSDGSMKLVQKTQQIDTTRLGTYPPKYSSEETTNTVFSCSNIPKKTIFTKDSELVLVTVPASFASLKFKNCQMLFDSVFEKSNELIFTVKKLVDGIWTGENFATSYCEAEKPELCSMIGGKYKNKIQEVSKKPLKLMTTTGKCSITNTFIFEGRVAKVNTTVSAGCNFEPHDFTAMSCKP